MQKSHWPTREQIDWPTALFLTLMPIIGTLGTAFALYHEGFSWGMLAFSFVFAILTNLAITTGYHRLFSHRSYEAHPVMRAILVFIGTSAWQSSVLKWCTDHRVHHAKEDTDLDPYAIHKGFWFAHLGWMIKDLPEDYKIHCPDLQKDRLLKFQHDHYILCAIAVGFLLPMGIGALFGYPLTGLFMGGALRVALTQQSTFFVNSLCHYFGKQPYSDEISAKDSLFVAILTHGEGYHNFHHKFQVDYRAGIRWWQWDPTKWVINTAAYLGLATKLRTVSQTEILKARLHMESLRLTSKGHAQETFEHLRDQLIRAQARLRTLSEDYKKAKAQYVENSRERIQTLQEEMRIAHLEFQYGMKQWRALMKSPAPIRIRY